MAPFAARTEGGPVRGLAVTSGSEAAAGSRRTSRLVIAAPRTQIRIPCISFCTGILCIFLEYMEYMEYTAVYSIVFHFVFREGSHKNTKTCIPGSIPCIRVLGAGCGFNPERAWSLVAQGPR